MSQKNPDIRLSAENFEGIIFDLDGVITDTASLHAAAWKTMLDAFLGRHGEDEGGPFQPFDLEKDYLPYVDGKPRLDGLKSFLDSRGIALPEGSRDDPPGADTLHGLGKAKNADFLQRVRQQGAKVYESTLAFIHSAKKQGLKIAVISSSKSCAMILDSIDLADTFEVRVDGVDSQKLGLAGKPAPDIFLEAARQLEINPARTLVVEDAVSGVRAGRAGGFGLVIGIARSGNQKALQEHGADLVVEDLSEICLDGTGAAAVPLPSALDGFEAIARQAHGRELAVFLDYDGTLAPIAETPEQALIPEASRRAVLELSRLCAVAIISGRDLKDVRDMVRIDSIFYAGSHGFDIAGPEDLQIERPVGEEFLPELDKAEQTLSGALAGIEGVLLERKKYAIAIHYRRANPENVEEVEGIVDQVTADHPTLRKSYGKKIFELQPRMDWHKGKALLFLLEALDLEAEQMLPIFIGDDVTDEDGFRALKGQGVGIVVGDRPYETAADFSLKNPDEVREFLLRLIPLCGRA